MFKIKTMNKISPLGLDLFPKDKYQVGDNIADPDAILVRSADLKSAPIPDSVKAIARAGAGVNNIPIPDCTKRNIVVFNTPGANANAVKELTLTGLLISSRRIPAGVSWLKTLADKGAEVPDLVEKGKSKFVGPEILGKTLGVVGLGAIGAMVANAAMALGMKVAGYDPFLSVGGALRLMPGVQYYQKLEDMLAKADYVTLHLPQTDSTKNTINAKNLAVMKKGARLLNMARGGLVNKADVIAALKSGQLSAYVTDFGDADYLACENAICLPHLGASTPEAEDNCAIMAVQELMDYLENGVIRNSVNFPKK
jgi:D-3-phosphoglycerate dehydrogenase